MNNYVAINDINSVLSDRALPTVTMWNRLEARPRTDNFDRALKAEIRDPLWMLCRQWQMGEFQGDDAGTPVYAKLHMHTTRLNKYVAAGNSVQVYDESVPLEAKVEQRPLPFSVGSQDISLDLRLQMGRQFLKLANSVGSYKADFIAAFPVAAPDPTAEADAPICAHRESWRQFAAAAGRTMDGYELYLHLKGGNAAYSTIGSFPAGDMAAMDVVASKFVSWFERLYYQPSDPVNNAWKPSFLEYQFEASAPVDSNEKVFTAKEYYHGHMDWYNLDIDSTKTTLGTPTATMPPDPQEVITRSFIPTPITFDGMPNTRWWTFEDSLTNFGDLAPDTTDVAKLLLAEFGLVYANDWFLVPFTLPAGSVANIEGLMVRNVFGENYWVTPAGSGANDLWQRWSMYTLNTIGASTQTADTSLLVLPTVPKIQESKAVEEVFLIRDEMANMVWGIEKTVPLPDGSRARGGEAASDLHQYYQRLIDEGIANGSISVVTPTEMENDAAIRYKVVNSVPENWIPFLPVHMPGSDRSIQLQRAALPRILENDPDPPVKVRPRTTLLREGLDLTSPVAYFVHEEEVPRAGARVAQTFQRTRWYNGRICNWFGVRKHTGRGEGSSGLAYDQIITKDT